MYTPGYRSREQAAQFSLDAEGLFQGVDLSQLILAAGNTALYDDRVLTPDAHANKQDGPRSAIYSVVDFRNGILLTAARLVPNTDDEALKKKDIKEIDDSVRDYASGKEILDRKTFGLAHSITAVGAFPGRREPLLNTGVELRIAPDETSYVTLLVPSYFLLAPKIIARYIAGKKRMGQSDDINPVLKDLAYANDRKKVARLLAVSAACHILDNYAEKEQLEAQFKED